MDKVVHFAVLSKEKKNTSVIFELQDNKGTSSEIVNVDQPYVNQETKMIACKTRME